MSSFEDALNKWNTPIKKSEDNIDNLGNIEGDPEYQKALKSWNNTPDVPKSKTPVITPMATRVPLPITMPISTPPVITADNQGIPSWGSVAGKSLAAGLPDSAGSMVNALVRMPIKGINIGLSKLGIGTDPEGGLAGVAGKFVEGQEKLAQKTMEGLENMTPAQEFVSAGLRAVPNVLTAAFMGAGTGGLVAGLNAASKAGAMLPAVKTGTSAAVQLARMAPFGTGAAGSYAREAELEGASFTEQLLYGAAGGLAEMGTELPVVEGVLKFASKIKNVPAVEQGAKNLLQRYGKLGVDWFKNIAKETAQEAVIEPITGTAKKATYQPDMPLYGEGGVVDPAAMWESGKAGASMSLILTALGLPATSMAHVRVTKAIEENRPLDQNEIDQVAKDIQGDIQQPVSAQQPTKGEILPKVDVEAWNAAGQTMQTGQTKQIDTQKATLESGSNAKLISDGREILPTTREKEGAKAIAPETTPTTSDEAILEPADKSILPGQKHTLKTYGEVEIVNTDDPKKIIIRNQKGKEVSIARDRFERLRQEEAEAQKSDVIDLPEETDNIRIINGEVFYKDNGATTAKRGYAWFTNRESRFGNKRKSIVLPDRKQQKGQAPPVDTSTQAPYNDINTIENQKAGAKNVPGIQVRNQTSDEETLSKIEQQVRQRAAGTIPEGTRVYEPVADETKGTKKNKDVQAAREIAKLFGHRFVYFRTNPELKKISKELYETANNFNGANVDGTIVINADRTNPAHAVTGHEIVHEIAKDKEIYEDFINIIKGLTTEEGHAAVKELIDAYNEAGITISEERAWEEFAADFVAEQMTKKEFWEKLAERSPSAVQKAINVIKKIISSLRKMVEPGDSVSQFIRDLELAQDIAVDAVAKYLDKTTQKKAEGVLSEADKKFLDGITKSGTTLATVIENTRDDINKKIETVVGWLKAEIAEGKPGKRIMIDDPQADFSYDPKWYSIPSTHAKWYRDFWAEHNRKPSNRDLKEIAEDWLRNGVDAKETYMSAGEDIPPDTEFLELEAFLSELQRIDEAITRGYEEAELAGTQDVRGNQEDIGTGADIRFSAKNKEIGYKESGQLLSVEEQLSFSFNTQVKKTLDQLEFNFPEIKGKEATRDAAKAIVEIQQQQKEGSDLSDQRGEVDRDRKHSGSRIKTVARDYARKLLNKGRISFVGKRIKSPEELAIMAQVLRDPRFETFRIFFTRTLQDGSKEIVWHTGVTSKIPGTARVSVGDTAQERADWINNTFRQGAFHNADGYFFMHNHPTGDPKPSKQDLNVSEHFFRSIKGLNFEGHIIINSNRYSFISPDDVIAKKYGIFILPNITKDALLTPDKPHPLLGKIPVDASGHATSASMAALVYQHKAPKGFSVLFYFSPQLKVRGIQEVPSINFSDEKKFKSWLRDQAIEFGGQNVVLVAENDDVFNYAKTLIKDNYFLDVINMSGGRSAQEMGFTPSGEDVWMGKKEKGIETWEERMKYLVAGQPLFQLKVKGGRWTKAKEQGTQKQQPTGKKTEAPDPFAGHTPESEKIGFLPRGFNVILPGIAKPKRTSFDKHTFENEKIEKEYRSSYGVKKPGIIQQAKEGITESWHGLSRTFKNLDPKDPKFAIAIKELARYPQLKQKAGDKASRMLDAFLHELGPERYNIFRRKVLLDDLAEEVRLGHELPGEWTPEEVEKELTRIEPKIDEFVQKALGKRKAGLRQVVDEYIAAAKEIGFDPSGKFNRENYYRHQVLDYMEVNQRMVPGTGAKVKAKTNYGWQKQRTGKSRKSINTDYLQAEYEVLSQMIYETEKDKMLRRLDKEYSIYDKLVKEAKQKNHAVFQEILKENPAIKKEWDLQKWNSSARQQKFIKETLGEDFVTWEDVIPDGYVAWQPRDGRAFYRAQALPEQMVEELLSGALQEIGVALEDIKTVLAVGKEFKHYVLPVELAETLDNIQPMQPQNPFTRSTKFLLSQWKGWTLTGNPRSVVKYNFRNLSGDFDGVIAAAGLKPTKPSFVQKRARELWDAMKNGRFTPDMKEWWEQGGMGSLLYAQEITDINKIPQFKNLMDDSSLRSKIFSLPKNYLEFTRNMTNYREGILRYTMYVYYKQHLKENGGLPKFYGASIPAQIKGLKTIPDRAYQLSKDALGSYDEVTEAGRWIRQHVIPFWSWNEVNFKRYKRLLANALSNEDLQKNTGQAMAKTLGIAGALSAKSLMTLGRITLQVTALSVLITLWNNFFFPDEEDDLPEDVRTKPHIIFGRNDKGEVIYFSRLGALNDFLDWFGLDNLQNDVQDLRTSRKDLKEQISDMAWAPLNKFINGLSPFLKTPLELISGSTYYPDARTPRRIRDKGEYAASTVGLTEEYKRLAGKPAKEKYAASWQNALYYRAKPDESAYYYALDLKRKFEEKVQGKRPSESYNDSPKSKALYYFKQSLKFGDQEKAYKYIVDYFENGGTAQGVNLSLQTMNPLYGLSAKPEKGQTVSEQIEFHNWLNERDRDKVRKALKYYNETVQFNPKNQSEKQIYTTIERMILATRKNEERRKKLMMPIIKAMVKQAN